MDVQRSTYCPEALSRGIFDAVDCALAVRRGNDCLTVDEIIDLVPEYVSSGPPTERSGFEDMSEVALTYSRANRRLTVAPVGADYNVWHADTVFNHTATYNVVHTDVEGFHYWYFDEVGVLHHTTVWDDRFILGPWAFVAYLYWDAVNKREILDLFFECHGKDLTGEAHWAKHFDDGTSWRGGLALTNLLTGQTGALDSHAQFGLASGNIADEDIRLAVSAVLSTAGLPILGLEGAVPVLRQYAQAGFPVMTDVTAGVGATGRLIYNELVGGVWQYTVVPDNRYVLCHVFATTSNTDALRPYAVPGQAWYNNALDAIAGAATEANAIKEVLPIAERKLLATVIYQTKNSYGNAVKARTIAVSATEDYIDWRREAGSGSGASGIPDHNSTTNRDVLGAHPASAITVDASAFTCIPNTVDDAQEAFDEIDSRLCSGGMGSPCIPCPHLLEEHLDICQESPVYPVAGDHLVYQGASPGCWGFLNGGIYVPRGVDVNAFDLDQTGMTTDGTDRDWDLSGILPSNAIAARIRLVIRAASVGWIVRLRRNGLANSYESMTLATQVANTYKYAQGVVACDENQVVEYYATNGVWNTIGFVVLGWYIR